MYTNNFYISEFFGAGLVELIKAAAAPKEEEGGDDTVVDSSTGVEDKEDAPAEEGAE